MWQHPLAFTGTTYLGSVLIAEGAKKRKERKTKQSKTCVFGQESSNSILTAVESLLIGFMPGEVTWSVFAFKQVTLVKSEDWREVRLGIS